MATSSIFTNIRLETEEQWETLLDALEESKRKVELLPKPNLDNVVWMDKADEKTRQEFYRQLEEAYSL